MNNNDQPTPSPTVYQRLSYGSHPAAPFAPLAFCFELPHLMTSCAVTVPTTSYTSFFPRPTTNAVTKHCRYTSITLSFEDAPPDSCVALIYFTSNQTLVLFSLLTFQYRDPHHVELGSPRGRIDLADTKLQKSCNTWTSLSDPLSSAY
jgi:hypothetical protein